MLIIKEGGEKWGLRAGDQVLEVNGYPVRDILDWIFYADSETISLRIKDKSEKSKQIIIERSSGQEMGIRFEPMVYRHCPNKCLFCFVDQLPAGLRKSLYFKDEDYRLSFLFGNYITLTNLSEDDLRRIITQRLSPLYISVHTTDDSLRRKMLGNPKAPSLLPLMRRLVEGGIVLHTQIVLCPGLNDGFHLRRTVQELSSLYPGVRSLAVVPVGLTKWRRGLHPLRSIERTDSLELIKKVEGWQRRFRRKIGSGFVWLADEIYLKAERPPPPLSHYEDFPQLENGVGMWRLFKERWKRISNRLKPATKGEVRLTLVTGRLAHKLMEEVIDDLNKLPKVEAKLIVLSNRLFGEEVTVSGLLSGEGILEGISESKIRSDALFLPPNCLNEDGQFLDDLSPEQMEKELNCRIFFGLEEGFKALSLLREDPLEYSGKEQNLSGIYYDRGI